MITKRTTDMPSEQEIKCFADFCVAHSVNQDDGSGAALANYIMVSWNVVCTDESLGLALPKLVQAGQVKIYSPAEAMWKALWNEDTARATTLDNWVNSGANRSLIREGNEGILNRVAILSELRGRDINGKNIQDAISRVAQRSGLYFTPAVATPDPRRHQDDGTGFLSQKKDGKYRPDGRINHSYIEPSAKKEVSRAPADAWETLCQSAMQNYGTPSQRIAMQELFDKARASGKSFRETYTEISKLRQSYERIMAR